MSDLTEHLFNARSQREILHALATLTGKKPPPCSPDRVPTAKELRDWLDHPDCGRDDADDRLKILPWPLAADEIIERVGWCRNRNPEPEAYIQTRFQQDRKTPLPNGGTLIDTGRTTLYSVEEVHALWCTQRLPKKHPLAPLVYSWQRLAPVRVKAVWRADPILPAVGGPRLLDYSEDAAAVSLGLVPENARPQLPLFPSPSGPRVALLELADAAGLATMAQGRGAPLELRLAVWSLLITPIEHRGWADLRISVRDLRNTLFPNGWKAVRDWPRLRKALFRLRDLSVPVNDRGARWYPFALRLEPGTRPRLEDEIGIQIELPDGAGAGPVVDRAILAQLGVQSGPGFRAYLAAHTVTWVPGVTRVVVPKSGGRRTWSQDPKRYSILTAEDRRRLAFGPNDADRNHRTRNQLDAPWDNLPGLVVHKGVTDPETGISGWRLLPEVVEKKWSEAYKS